MHQSAKGIILKAASFQDYDQILTVFSEDLGLIKIIFKNSKKHPAYLTTPLTQAEFIYVKGKSDLLKCLEISPINTHAALRGSLEVLEASGDILRALLKTQPLQVPTPDLYKLTSCYLKNLPLIANPYLLADSFKLKILRHDGLLSLKPMCTKCECSLQELFMSQGESYCSFHTPHNALEFNTEETTALLILAYSQSFSQLELIHLTPNLREKIKILFLEIA